MPLKQFRAGQSWPELAKAKSASPDVILRSQFLDDLMWLP